MANYKRKLERNKFMKHGHVHTDACMAMVKLFYIIQINDGDADGYRFCFTEHCMWAMWWDGRNIF